MPPVVNPLVTAVVSLRLGDFVIVVREFQINTASVNVDRILLEERGGHR